MEFEDMGKDDPTKLVKSSEPQKSDKRRPPRAGMGRPKGIPNKSTKAVKEALVEAFEKRGGVPALIKWSNAEPTEFYKLWAKLLPNEVKATGSISVTLEKIIAGDFGKSNDSD